MWIFIFWCPLSLIRFHLFFSLLCKLIQKTCLHIHKLFLSIVLICCGCYLLFSSFYWLKVLVLRLPIGLFNDFCLDKFLIYIMKFFFSFVYITYLHFPASHSEFPLDHYFELFSFKLLSSPGELSSFVDAMFPFILLSCINVCASSIKIISSSFMK